MVLFLLGAFFFAHLGLASPAERQGVPHPLQAVWANLAPLGRLPPGTQLRLSLGLPLRNVDQLDVLIQRLQDPSSPEFRHYLTAQEFANHFAPDPADYEALISFAQASGLSVMARHPNRTLLDVRGAAFEIEKAFHVKLNTYQHPSEPRTFFGPDVLPAVKLNTRLLAIGGLDDFQLTRPAFHYPPASQSKPQLTGSGPGGYYLGLDFRHAYAPGVELAGRGQSIALVEFDGFYPGDIAAYKTLAHLPDVPVTTVLLDGFSGVPRSTGGNEEVALDIEMCISMATNLDRVISYEGFSANSVLNRIATDQAANQISASWTYPINSSTVQIFQQFIAQGQSFFNASGDTGAYGSGGVASPTQLPYITVVGGTELVTQTNSGGWLSEVVWPMSSGGIGSSFAIPAWQLGIDMTANQGSSAFRNLPDVAMIADNTWVLADNGAALPLAGTSIATPLWAAFTALANELAATAGQPTVGFVNPAIYAFGKGSNALPYTSLFHDVTVGNNQSTANLSRFPAAAGYDLCTGWGSPQGSDLLLALAFPEPLRITPAAPAIFSGLAGGPFTPAGATYTLTNSGLSPFSWSLNNTSTWLNVDVTSGTLSPGGGGMMITLSPSSAATNLGLGFYQTSVVFSNANDNSIQIREVSLAIITPPVILSQPTDQAPLAGATARFVVGTATNALLYYQWRVDGTNLSDGGQFSGALSKELTIASVNSNNVRSYSVMVSNSTGTVISSNAALSLTPSAPVIIMQPISQTVLPGSNVTFKASVIGSTPYFYRWQLNGSAIFNTIKYSGTATDTLVVSNAYATGVFSVQVNNSLGSVTSTGAVLSLVPVTIPGVTQSSAWSFGADANSGVNPYSPLVAARNGFLYGTTSGGGVTGGGVVYRINGNGAFLNLATLNGSSTGSTPFAGLTLTKDGTLYGVSSAGGTFDDGLIFRVNAQNVLSVVGSFNGVNGLFPVAGMTQGGDGLLYGTLYQGGAYGYGGVFRSTTSGSITSLVSFSSADGSYPSSVLTQAADGNFYGTTENGGTRGDNGTLFRMNPTGVFESVYSFTNTDDGGVPIPGLVQTADGDFYGVTSVGGIYNQGTVFRYSPEGTFSTVYAFRGAEDGGNPFGGLLLATDGNLYGTTQVGGDFGYGTVFRFAPNGELVTICQFDGFNGANPSAALAQGVDGSLFGTTLYGGTFDSGSIFKLSFSGALQITGQPSDQTVYAGSTAVFSVAVTGGAPYHFQWQRDGTNLLDGGNVLGSGSNRLVITNVALEDSAVYSVLVTNSLGLVQSDEALLSVTFAPPKIVLQPASQTVVLGATAVLRVQAVGEQPLTYQWQQEGTNLVDGAGVTGSTTSTLTLVGVSFANSGTYSVVVSDAVHTRTSKSASLTVVNSSIPGVASGVLHQFNGSSEGAFPYAGVIQGLDANLYGVASEGGAHFNGTFFRSSLSGGWTTMASFDQTFDGQTPYGRLVQLKNGSFYGATFSGGGFGDGIAYRISGTAITDLYDFFGPSDGANPYAGMVQAADGYLYGSATAGGTSSNGVIYQLDVAGNLTVVYEFTAGSDGYYPFGKLVQGPSGILYGTALFGGDNSYGTIFSLTTNGVFTTLVSLSFGQGAYPKAGLVFGADGALYGTAFSGGANGQGTVFRVETNGNFATLASFKGTNGAAPASGLVLGTDGNFYGTTSAGGLGGQGTVFRLSPGGQLTTLLWFDGFNGASPQDALIQAGDGSFYGTTPYGGLGFNSTAGGGYGLVFKVTTPIFKTANFSAAPGLATVPYSSAIQGQATGPVGDPLSFARLTGPGWLQVAADGGLSGTPLLADVGTNVFTISVSDTNGLSATATLQIMVTAPLILQIVQAGQQLQLNWVGGRPPYQVQTAASLMDGNWFNLGSPVPGNSLMLNPTNAAAYFRVKGN